MIPHHSFHHHKHTHDPHKHPKVLDVILVCSNTRRYESRYRLFKKVLDEVSNTPHVRVTVVELAYAERPHMLVTPSDVRHVHLRNPDELWHKEQMINIGLTRLPDDWKYVCWMDADVSFVNSNWAKEIIEALQHYAVIQPWSHCIDLGPSEETFATHNSFCSEYMRNHDLVPGDNSYYGSRKNFPHSGYVWAARRSAINNLSGLLDTAILGAGDFHMAWGLIGKAVDTFHAGVTQGYKNPILAWEERALFYVKKNIGCMPGTILHYFHGKKRDRKYQSRWQILVENAFDPSTDLIRDYQGLWRLRVTNERQQKLRDGIREYMASRNEDSIDLE